MTLISREGGHVTFRNCCRTFFRLLSALRVFEKLTLSLVFKFKLSDSWEAFFLNLSTFFFQRNLYMSDSYFPVLAIIPNLISWRCYNTSFISRHRKSFCVIEIAYTYVIQNYCIIIFKSSTVFVLGFNILSTRASLSDVTSDNRSDTSECTVLDERAERRSFCCSPDWTNAPAVGVFCRLPPWPRIYEQKNVKVLNG